jgi:hypothetical protein
MQGYLAIMYPHPTWTRPAGRGRVNGQYQGGVIHSLQLGAGNYYPLRVGGYRPRRRSGRAPAHGRAMAEGLAAAPVTRQPHAVS